MLVDLLPKPVNEAYASAMRFAPDPVVVDQLADRVSECLTPDVAQRLAKVRLGDKTQTRLEKLAEKSTEGRLSSDEQNEYETYVAAIDFITVLQAKARSMIAHSSPR
jgi:hypothetical protein